MNGTDLPVLGSWVVDVCFGLLADIMDELANIALAAILLFFLFYLIYLVVRRYTYDRDRMRWGDVFFEVSLVTGVIALFMMPVQSFGFSPQYRLNVSIGGEGIKAEFLRIGTERNASALSKYGEKAPLIIWLPYAVAKTGWDMGDYMSKEFFQVPMAAIPSVFKERVEQIRNEALQVYMSVTASHSDMAIRASENASTNRSFWDSVFEKVQPFVGSLIAVAMGAITGATSQVPTMVLSPSHWPILLLGGALSGGAMAFFRQHFVELLIMLGLIFVFYGAIADMLVRSLMFILMLPVSVVTFVAQPRRGRDGLVRQVARGFAIALEGLAIVFMARVGAVLFAVFSNIIIPSIVGNTLKASSGTGAIIVWMIIATMLPIVLIKPLLGVFRGIEHYIAEALNTTGLVGANIAGRVEQQVSTGFGLLR